MAKTRTGDLRVSGALDSSRVAALALSTGDVFYALRVVPDVAFEFVSETVRVQLGYSPADLLADSSVLFSEADPRDASAQRDLLATPPGTDVQVTLPMRRRDGSVVWTEHRGRTRRRTDGSVVLEGCMRDVTDLHDAQQRLAESEATAQFLLQESSDIVALQDPGGGLRWVSPAIERMLGWSPDEPLSRNLGLFHPDDLGRVAAVRARLDAGEDCGTARVRLRRKDGTYLWTDSTVRGVRDRDGRLTALVVVTRDVDAAVRAEERRAEAEAAAQAERELLRATMDAMLDPHVLLSAVRDPDGRIVDLTIIDANHAALERLGSSGGSVVGSSIRIFAGGAGHQTVLAGLAAVVENGHPLVADAVPFLGGSRDGRRQLFDVRGVRVGDGLSLTWRNVTQAHEAAERVEFLAGHDPLTSLANRHGLTERLAPVLSHPPRNGTRVAVLFVDVDGMKPVNDTYGHGVGDAVLVTVAQRIAGCVRSDDTPARIGGDEFVVALPSVRSAQDALEVAAKIHRSLDDPVVVDGHRLNLTVSIGIALSDPGDDVDSLVHAADQALYRAKREGRDRTAAVGR